MKRGLPVVPSAQLTRQLATLIIILFVPWIVWRVSEPLPEAFHDFFKAYYPAGAALWGEGATLSSLIEGADFVNLPIVSLLFAPLGLWEKHLAALIFLLLGICATAAALYWLVILSPRRSVAFRLLPILFALNRPLIYSLKEGNTSHFVLALLIASLFLARQKADFSVGLLIGVASLIKLPLLLFIMYFLLCKRWISILGIAIIVTFGIVLSLAIFGMDLHFLWLQRCIIPFLGKPVHAFNVQSLDGFLIRLYLNTEWRGWGPQELPAIYMWFRWFIIGCILACSAYALRRVFSRDDNLGFAIVITISVIISPLSWLHYYCWLLFPWGLYIGGSLRGDNATRWLMIGGVLFASLPAVNFAWFSPSPIWQTLASAWLFGGLLTLAGLLRSATLKGQNTIIH